MQRPFFLIALTSCVIAGAGAAAESRRPAGGEELNRWVDNMLRHGFLMQEMHAVTGIPFPDLARAMARVQASDGAERDGGLEVLPYPGGRHPRIGFLEGAIDPQRDTKISVFTPWDPRSYVVVDIPEAIWSNLGLTYLAHTHIDTIWSRDGVTLPEREWTRREDDSLVMDRQLPNGIHFGTVVYPEGDHVAMVMWLHNGTDSALSDLRVQNCVMLKAAEGFNAQTNENKLMEDPYVACESEKGGRWIITAWEPCHRPWANPPVPCLHSDPKFPDLDPGQTSILNGWLSFYEGADVHEELRAIGERWRRLTMEDIRAILPETIP